MTASPQPLHPEPPSGRVFEGTRAVRSTDVTPDGRFRFDALARALQDVAGTGWQAPYGWLLRREDVLATQDWLPSRAELEYHRPILPGARPRLLTRAGPADVQLWLLDGEERLATGRLSR